MVHMYLWNRSARNNRLCNRAAHLQAARKTEQDVCGVIHSFLLLLEDLERLWHHRPSRRAQITGWQVGKKSQVGFNYYTGQIAVGAAVSQGNITCSQGTEVLSFSSCTYFSALSLYTYVVTELQNSGEAKHGVGGEVWETDKRQGLVTEREMMVNASPKKVEKK